MGLPLARLVAVCLALSSAGCAELQRGERRQEDRGGPEQRFYLGVGDPPLPSPCGYHLGWASCPQALLTLGGGKEGGQVVLGSRRPFEGDLLAREVVPAGNPCAGPLSRGVWGR